MQSPKLLFTLNRSKITKSGKSPVMLRITVNKTRITTSTGYKLHPDQWDQTNQQITGNKVLASTFIAYATKIRYQALQVERDLHLAGIPVTARAIMDGITGNETKSVTLLQAIAAHNERASNLVGKDITRSTYNRYQVTQRKLLQFIGSKYKGKDVPLQLLSVQFITDFEYYLKVQDGMGQNTASKHLKILKKIVRFSISQQWLSTDPFSTFRCRTIQTDRGFLTRQELKLLEEKEFTTERLATVRDIFIFACYTGLSFSDLQKLAPDHLFTDETGDAWISLRRTKTGTESLVPILPKPNLILARYSNHPECKYKGKLLPLRSNQKMNEYLHEIAVLCEIEKKITCHLARHTFATTITLANGVSTESVSKMLGHKNLRTTQIYAKMTIGRIGSEMNQIKDKL